MDIDLSILRMLEREKEISFEVLAEAIEQALLTAYQRATESQHPARVELDRQSGHVTVWAREVDEDGTAGPEYDDTPEGFGRIAATTAKQVMLQRLRDAEDEIRFGEFSGKEGDIISGVIQQGRNPDDVMVDLGKLEALLPVSERVPGEDYRHGTRIKCLVTSVRKGMRGPQITLSRSHPTLVKKLFALEVPEIADGTVEIAGIAREAGHRTKIAVHSTVPSAISGTSRANSFLTSVGCERDSVICGPRMPLRTDVTRHLMRSPWTYFSPGTRSLTGRSASSLPRSTITSSGLRPCWITPEMMSPSLPENSPKRISSSASRSRCSMTCLAVVAAIRPNPAGVSSYSGPAVPSSSTSRAHTVTWPLLRSSSTRAGCWDSVARR